MSLPRFWLNLHFYDCDNVKRLRRASNPDINVYATVAVAVASNAVAMVTCTQNTSSYTQRHKHPLDKIDFEYFVLADCNLIHICMVGRNIGYDYDGSDSDYY